METSPGRAHAWWRVREPVPADDLKRLNRRLQAEPPSPSAGDYDALRAIPAREYVPALTGRDVSPSGKVRCPLHGGGAERTPSLHVYDDGWACFGRCLPRPGRDHAGGDIFEFGARLYGIEPRGRGFHLIARRLARDLLCARGAA